MKSPFLLPDENEHKQIKFERRSYETGRHMKKILRSFDRGMTNIILVN